MSTNEIAELPVRFNAQINELPTLANLALEQAQALSWQERMEIWVRSRALSERYLETLRRGLEPALIEEFRACNPEGPHVTSDECKVSLREGKTKYEVVGEMPEKLQPLYSELESAEADLKKTQEMMNSEIQEIKAKYADLIKNQEKMVELVNKQLQNSMEAMYVFGTNECEIRKIQGPRSLALTMPLY